MTQVTRELIELAERVEKAEGADREIDVEIARAVGYECPNSGSTVAQIMSWAPSNTIPEIAKWVEVPDVIFVLPKYTASIDAAMSLIDASTFFHLSRFDADADGRSEAHVYPNRNVGDDYKAEAATPALALCAAALRARSAVTL